LLRLRKRLVKEGISLIKDRTLKVPKPIQLRDVAGLQRVLNHNNSVIYDDAGENHCGSYQKQRGQSGLQSLFLLKLKRVPLHLMGYFTNRHMLSSDTTKKPQKTLCITQENGFSMLNIFIRE
jgi:hypothetical protein